MTDSGTVRIVIISLAVVTLAALAGVIWLVHDQADAASIAIVAGFGTTALGALAGVLVSTHSQPDPTVTAAIDASHAAGVSQTEAAVRALAD